MWRLFNIGTGRMAGSRENRYFSGENMQMQNICAWIENAYESRGFLCNKAIAHNLINRMWGELWARVFPAPCLIFVH
jgi:hypothetical protein